MLQHLIAPVANVIGGIIKQRGEIKAAEHQRKLNKLSSEADWEATMADASKESWKDEFWCLILAIPIFMVGYAIIVNDTSVIDRVHLGFDALEKLPDWYQYLLFICISSSFGIRGASALMNLRKK